jgi:hypothetical protein
VNMHERITIRQIAAEATAKYNDDEENRDLIRKEFDSEVMAAIETGELAEPVPTVRELRASWAWKMAADEARSMGNRIRDCLRHGESMREFEDEFLDCMIVVCAKRRSTLRLMTDHDLDLMAEESANNRKKIDLADDALQAGIAAFRPTLQRFRNFDEYRLFGDESAS